MERQDPSALIVGAGPCGLAAALMLLERGWSDIVVADRRKSADAFDRGRAFNYQLDGRGQLILEELGFGADDLRAHGLPNDSFRQVFFAPDGSSRRFDFPALLPGRKTPYWMTRDHLLRLLEDGLQARNADARVTLHYDHELVSVQRGDDGRLYAMLRAGDGSQTRLAPRLLLGCDGVNSRVRTSLQQLTAEAPARTGNQQPDFSLTVMDSPSAELRYKVLSLPARFSVKGADGGADDHTLAYCFTSTYRRPHERMALFALPVPGAEEPRNINIILHRDHHFWTLSGPEAIRDYLRAGFPQLDLASLLRAGELEEFAAFDAGGFPRPQYANSIHQPIATQSGEQDVLLLGDAAHAFPPDLGMGVNSALEEVFLLKQLLDAPGEPIRGACEEFSRRRLPENRALVRLVRWVHPYQYNQVPWRLKFWFLKFILQRSLTRLTRGAIPAPGFVQTQKHRQSFVAMEQQALRAERAFWTVIAACLVLVAGTLAWI